MISSETDRRARKMPEGDTGVQETHGLSGKAVEQTESGRWPSRPWRQVKRQVGKELLKLNFQWNTDCQTRT